MMISTDDVKKLANLARVEVSDEELGKIASEIESILSYVSRINEASVNLPEMQSSDFPNINVFRADENALEPGKYTEAILGEAPEREGEYIKVKKILS